MKKVQLLKFFILIAICCIGFNCADRINIIVPGLNDDYEDDDTFETAYEISVNTIYKHTIYPAGEFDYMKFWGVSGSQYIIETTVFDIDTYMDLYSSSSNLIDSDDDSGVGTASKIVYTPGVSDYYYIKIRGFSSASVGYYNLEVNK